MFQFHADPYQSEEDIRKHSVKMALKELSVSEPKEILFQVAVEEVGEEGFI